MRKLFKKSLACVLAVALCLTAMVGVLSVSADVVGTLTMVGFEGVVGGDAAYVTATFTAPDAELISESFIDVAVSNGATVESVALDGANSDNEIELNDAKTRFNIRSANGLATAVVTIYLANADAAGTYTVTLTDVTSATDSQSIITFGTASIDAVIAEKACTHDRKVPVGEAKDATCTTDGITAGEKCEDCGVVLVEQEVIKAKGHEFTEDGCSNCDEDLPVVTVRGRGNIFIQEKFGFYADLNRADIDAYDDFYVNFEIEHYRTTETQRYDFVTENLKYKYVEDGEEVPEGFNKHFSSDSKKYRFLVTGVTGYEMTLTTHAVVYFYNEGKLVAKSSPIDFCIKDIGLDALKGDYTDEVKSTVMDLLNYGTEAQKYFASTAPGSPLANNTVYPNNGCDAYQEAYATKDSVISLDKITDTSSFDLEDGIATNLADRLDIFIDASNEIRFMLNHRIYDRSKIRFEIYYTDSYGNQHDIELTPSTGLQPDDRGYWWYRYNSIALYDVNENITVKYYEDQTLLATRVVSLKDIVYQKKNATALQPLLTGLLKLGHSSYNQFFG